MGWKQMDGKIGGHEPYRWKNRWIWKEIVGGIDRLRPGSTWAKGHGEIFQKTDFRLDILDSEAERRDK